ncbi:MAG: outer membrane protein transport protein, partial [Leeuwenhoekiella sp.]
QTSGKGTGSIAYIFGNKGFLSFDYSYEDYSAIAFKPKNDSYFSDLNNSIDSELKAVSTYKVGGEYRLNNLSLRGGYKYQESPYKNTLTLGDLSSFSAGIGYSFGSTRLDFAYTRATQEKNPSLYNTGLTNTAFVDGVNSTVSASLSFRL